MCLIIKIQRKENILVWGKNKPEKLFGILALAYVL